MPPPHGAVGSYAAWVGGMSLAATVVLLGTARLARRLLPLAALLKLSLVFPDGAPSRFRVAFETGTVETLQARLAAARRDPSRMTAAQCAELLLQLVAMLDTHDRLTRGHSERVRAYAQAIGRELGLERGDLDRLNWAALLHDVGKLEVPSEILTKDGRPTEEEWDLIRRHPELGAALVLPLEGWLGDWCRAVAEHHERWDGAGYPKGLAGTDISLAGRIVAVADVFDVITSLRSYQEPSRPRAARAEITRCAGTQFDPAIVRAFLAISVRRSRLVAPAAWLAHALVLLRAPLVPAASGISAAAVAVGVVSTGGVGSSPVEPERGPVVAATPVVADRVSAGVQRKAQVPGPIETSQPRRKPGPRPRPAPRSTPFSPPRSAVPKRVSPVDVDRHDDSAAPSGESSQNASTPVASATAEVEAQSSTGHDMGAARHLEPPKPVPVDVPPSNAVDEVVSELPQLPGVDVPPVPSLPNVNVPPVALPPAPTLPTAPPVPQPSDLLATPTVPPPPEVPPLSLPQLPPLATLPLPVN